MNGISSFATTFLIKSRACIFLRDFFFFFLCSPLLYIITSFSFYCTHTYIYIYLYIYKEEQNEQSKHWKFNRKKKVFSNKVSYCKEKKRNRLIYFGNNNNNNSYLFIILLCKGFLLHLSIVTIMKTVDLLLLILLNRPLPLLLLLLLRQVH